MGVGNLLGTQQGWEQSPELSSYALTTASDASSRYTAQSLPQGGDHVGPGEVKGIPTFQT